MLSSPYPVPAVGGWRVMTSGAYVAIAVAGAWSLVFTPASYIASTPSWVTYVWSISLIVGGLLCAVAVALSKWRIEWIASWVLAFGVAVHAVLSWDATVDLPTNGARALILTAVTGLILARALLLSRIDRLARERRESQTPGEDAA